MSRPRERISLTSTLNDSGMPESFNVLVKEIRSLAIDIDLDRG